MIKIILSHKAYENDAYPIVKAFYPKEEILVKGSKDVIIEEGNLSKVHSCIQIDFGNDKIEIVITHNKDRKYKTITETPDPVKDKAAYKNAMKRQLYKMLSSISNIKLPWGILTGIRPVKLVYEMLDRGMDDSEIYNFMEREYLCSREKIDISIDIAKRERKLLHEIDYKKGYSIYIGIPFCPSTCLYCSFTSYSVERHADRITSYLNALEKEIKYGSTCFPDKKLTSVYLGGGTPTTLSAEQLDRLLGLIREQYDFTHVREFCVEAGRPDSISRKKLEVLKKWGVDRISINPQTMQQNLDLIGRRHTVEQIEEAFYLARETGHENINMDIIIGLPNESPEDVIDTLNNIEKLNPKVLLSILSIKRAARLTTEKKIIKIYRLWISLDDGSNYGIG